MDVISCKAASSNRRVTFENVPLYHPERDVRHDLRGQDPDPDRCDVTILLLRSVDLAKVVDDRSRTAFQT